LWVFIAFLVFGFPDELLYVAAWLVPVFGDWDSVGGVGVEVPVCLKDSLNMCDGEV
jgi:hypothetical protein